MTYEITVSRVVLYGCEIWSPELKEEYTSTVLINKGLWEIFIPGRDGVR